MSDERKIDGSWVRVRTWSGMQWYLSNTCSCGWSLGSFDTQHVVQKTGSHMLACDRWRDVPHSAFGYLKPRRSIRLSDLLHGKAARKRLSEVKSDV